MGGILRQRIYKASVSPLPKKQRHHFGCNDDRFIGHRLFLRLCLSEIAFSREKNHLGVSFVRIDVSSYCHIEPHVPIFAGDEAIKHLHWTCFAIYYFCFAFNMSTDSSPTSKQSVGGRGSYTVHSIRRKPKNQASTFTSSNEKERENVYIDTEDCGSVLIHFEDETHGVFTVSQVSAGRKNRLYFEIAADTATIAWDQEDPNRLWVGKRDEPNREIVRDPSILSPQAAALSHYPGGHQEGWPDGLKNLFLEFYAAVSERKAEKTETGHFSFATIEDGHQLMKLVEAILESHRSQKWVSIS